MIHIAYFTIIWIPCFKTFFEKKMIVFKKLFKNKAIYIYNMLVPIQDIQGLVYNEYINMDNALKIIKNWDDVVSK